MMPVKTTSSAAYDHREAMKKKPKTLSHIHVMESENGGHVVEHHFDHYEHPAEKYSFGKDQGIDMLTHVAKVMKVKAPKEEKEPDEDD